LSIPRFDSSDYEVSEREISSASGFNNIFNLIKEDLRALYKEMLNLTTVSIEDFERWHLEANVLEKRLGDLEKRVESRLLLAQGTEGYHSYFFENFSDIQNVDMDSTTAAVDLVSQQVSLDKASLERLFLNYLTDNDVSFKVKTSIGFIGRQDNSDIKDVFHQRSETWSTQIEMKEDKPVVCELLVKLGEDPVSISNITIEAHDSSQSAPMVITPLYSTDNYSFSQLPTNAYSQEIRSKGAFDFSTVEAKFIKFILTKEGPDPGAMGESKYQFGFKNIAFKNKTYTTIAGQDLISNTLYIADIDGNPVAFNKITLEACERLETNTLIRHFITMSNSTPITVDSNTVWYPISPASRVEALYPKVLDLGDLVETELTDVGISYSGTSTTYKNPAQSFHLLSQDTDDSVLDESIDATAQRYTFVNINERILDYQIKDTDYTGSGTGTALEIDENSLVILRNVGERGLTENDPVRSVQRGWRFEDPYYITVVEILDPAGISIDVGDDHIVIDDKKYTNKIGTNVLRGKTSSFNGFHEVKVHKKNWQYVTPDLDTLFGTSGLVAADLLYPYNHKLLIEGYSYGVNFPADQEKVYLGADTFFEKRMRKISIFDLTNNVSSNGYQYYALDRDAPTTHTGGNSSTRVFTVKVDGRNADAVNEKFIVRFNLINQQYTYFRYKATLITNSSDITPTLDSYKLKFGN